MRPLIAGLVLGALSACQATYVDHAREVRALLTAGQLDEAARTEEHFGPHYAKGDEALALLNRGALLTDAGRHAEANACLLRAEDLLADAYKRSAAGAVAEHTLSGAAADYLGADFERVLVHAYAIENSLAQGAHTDAAVEARRLVERLTVLGDVKGHGRRYQDDGFARWLAGAALEADGDRAEALQSYRAAARAFAAGPQRDLACTDARRLAPAPADAPECPGAVAPLASGEGELVLVHRAGLVPERAESRTALSLPPDPAHPEQTAPVVLALPELRPVQARVTGAALQVDDGPAQAALCLEDVQGVAQQTLEDDLPGYRTQATTRALARLAAGAGAGVGAAQLASKNQQRGNASQPPGGAELLGLAVGVATDAALSTAEEADKRSWFALPAWVAVARLRLPAGEHHVRVELRDPKGVAVRTLDLGTVRIEPGRQAWRFVRTVE